MYCTFGNKIDNNLCFHVRTIRMLLPIRLGIGCSSASMKGDNTICCSTNGGTFNCINDVGFGDTTKFGNVTCVVSLATGPRQIAARFRVAPSSKCTLIPLNVSFVNHDCCTVIVFFFPNCCKFSGGWLCWGTSIAAGNVLLYYLWVTVVVMKW